MLKIYLGKSGRIEGYDISSISGSFAVGSMVVFSGNKKNSNQYRKFKIKRKKGQDDVGCLREILLRRMKHKEWKIPDLVVLDGGKGQLRAARGLEVPVIALAKKEKRKTAARIYTPFSKKSLDLEELPEEVRKTLFALRDEAHRFAITYHKKRREKYILDL